MARVVVLVDNEPGEGLQNRWGFSAYVETDEWRALFDADTDPEALEHNAEALGIDFSSLDFAVLSHFHYDHVGGFPYVGKAAPGLKVYTPLEEGRLRSWGLEPSPCERSGQVAPNAWIVGPLRVGIPEQALAFRTPRGLVLLVGCSHPGVASLAEEALKVAGGPLHAVIGGYHSPPLGELDRLAGLAELICPMHCSGSRAREYVRSRYPEKFLAGRTGTVFEF